MNDLGARLFYLHTNTSFSSLKYDKRGYFARCDFFPHPVGAENNSYGRVSASYRSRNLCAKDKKTHGDTTKVFYLTNATKNLVHLQVPF